MDLRYLQGIIILFAHKKKSPLEASDVQSQYSTLFPLSAHPSNPPIRFSAFVPRLGRRRSRQTFSPDLPSLRLFPSPMGVMNIARPMIDIKNLAGLGQGTKQGIITAGSLSFLVVTHGRPLGGAT